jgi:hypothetical protein
VGRSRRLTERPPPLLCSTAGTWPEGSPRQAPELARFIPRQGALETHLIYSSRLPNSSGCQPPLS